MFHAPFLKLPKCLDCQKIKSNIRVKPKLDISNQKKHYILMTILRPIYKEIPKFKYII